MIEPYYQNDLITLYHGDSTIILPELGEYKLILTDPPYGQNETYGRGANTIANDNDTQMYYHLGKFAKSKTNDFWCAWWVGWKTFIEAVESFNNGKPNACVAWDKNMPGMGGVFRSQYELLVVYKYGDPKSSYNGGDVWRYTRSQSPKHPHEKPVDFLRKFIKHFTKKDENVLDCFAGSGSTALAAMLENRKCTLIEYDEKYCQLIADNCEQIRTGLTTAEQAEGQQTLFG